MSIAIERDLVEYCRETARRAKAASVELALARGEQKNTWLRQAAEQLRAGAVAILEANAADVGADEAF